MARLRKGDRVVVIRGNDKGKQGKIVRVIPERDISSTRSSGNARACGWAAARGTASWAGCAGAAADCAAVANACG